MLELDLFDVNADVTIKECLKDLTFCFCGILDNLPWTNASDLVKILSGRVTMVVSLKTSYLVVRETLEDGRLYNEGKKYQTTLEQNIKVVHKEKNSMAFVNYTMIWPRNKVHHQLVPWKPPYQHAMSIFLVH